MDVNNTKTIKDSILGNGLTPASNVEAGELLISSSSPFLILVEKEALDKVCSYCFAEKESSSLKRCSGCKVPIYCSAACQKKDWVSIHQKECSILKRMPGIPPTAVRGLIQLCLRNLHHPESSSAWMDLEGHVNKLRQSKRWDEIVLQSTAAVEFSKCPKTWMEWVTNLLCRMSTNAFRVTLPDDSPVGLCFSPSLALANHSCSPNAAIIFDGRSISLRSLNKIKSGEQILISYIDPIQPREGRRTELRERYFFTCECEVCKRDENPYQTFLRTRSTLAVDEDNNSQILLNIRTLVTQAEECKSKAQEITSTNALLKFAWPPISQIQSLVEESRATSNPAERLAKLNEALHFMWCFAGVKTYAIIPLPTIVNELYLHHLDTSAYIEALILLLFLNIHCDPFTYPQPTHPIRVLRLYTIAKLLKHIASLPTDSLLPPETTPFNEDQRQAIRSIDYVSAVQVFLILTKKGGVQESRFLKEVDEELEDVEGVQKERNGGGVGLELKRWMIQGGLAVEGKLMAETIVGGLRDLVGFVGRIVGDLGANLKEERDV